MDNNHQQAIVIDENEPIRADNHNGDVDDIDEEEPEMINLSEESMCMEQSPAPLRPHNHISANAMGSNRAMGIRSAN